ncbi:ribosome biogenesis GTPase Der [Demequina zhanjiangensis]|uniref:GTPase Der n=1 Tax=Demequina zhanjiangensis TaxID=3051659 RepID=A0ABT8G223_9MICO|nr:ribosome biogenesis GTPase Der [Demequina sp. SYSU T00b26]MDN4473188.1 ribosome biogenesis GTPase Der [Demequina sp. SYSU T00b26]
MTDFDELGPGERELPAPHQSDPEESLDEIREAALRAGLDAYELSEDDLSALNAEPEPLVEEALPTLAIIGRPNVGKSTLVNRIIGKRLAVVEDRPGVTRDRVNYPAEWAGRDFMLLDTGGWEKNVTGIDLSVAQAAEAAIDLADAIIFVVDATVGATATDEQVVRLLRKADKPVVLAANKVDGPQGELEAAALWNLGLGEPYPVSALHGRGTGDLLDAAMAALPAEMPEVEVVEGAPRRMALVGRPNVGKSQLLNKLAGENRVVVHDLAGTTRDPVDENVEIDGQPFVLVDTAGIRRRVHQTKGADFYASLRTQTAIERAEIALVLMDASVPLTEQDTRVISQVTEAGRAMVLVFNKWDLVGEDERFLLERSVDTDLVQLTWAPRVNLSALTGWHTNRLMPAVNLALSSWDQRISTGRLNSFLGELVAEHPHPVRSGKQPKILFGTQASTRPPRFVLFASGFLEPTYRRFIERRLRETFGFEGTPIQISVRVREKRRKR